MSELVDAARRSLGPVGTYLPIPFAQTPAVESQRAGAARLERAGYRTAWTNEVVGGKDAFVQVAVLLAATERMTFGTGIANVWARPAQTAQGAAAFLAEAYPGRFVLGLGAGYPFQAAVTGREFGSPLTTMRDYLAVMDDPQRSPASTVPYPRIIGAGGPKMAALAGDIADGAMPAGLPPAFTAQARKTLGPDKLLVVGLTVVLDSDGDRAKRVARQTVSDRVRLPSYATRLRRLGYLGGDVTEIDDRLVDAVVAHGDPVAVVAKVDEHLAAGADHVVIMATVDDYAAGLEQLEWLAPSLSMA